MEWQELERIFGDNLLFAYQTGSTVPKRHNPTSDIDLLVCVENEVNEQIIKFRDFYYRIHQQNELTPDNKYPGEVMSFSTLDNTLNKILNTQPRRTIVESEIYDGLVWAGMLSDDKIPLITHKTPQRVIDKSNEIIKKWNRELFGLFNTTGTKKLKDNVNFKDLDFIRSSADSIRRKIIDNLEIIEKILLNYESFQTIEDELMRSIDALDNIRKEERYLLKNHVNYLSTYLPVNLPLYSMVLYGFIPSLMAERNFIKPPNKAAHIVSKLTEIIFKDLFRIHIFSGNRNDFIDNFMKYSDVIIFTGKYSNALNLSIVNPNSLFIYNGAGINPIIIAQDADLESAVDSVIKTRLFNSGQDCAGPDSILVNDKIYNKFRKELLAKLKEIKIGDYENRENLIGKLIKPLPYVINGGLFEKYRDSIIFGSQIDRENQIVFPTVIERPLAQEKNYEEFFSPVIWLAKYDNDTELQSYFLSERYMDYAMYVSIFGSCGIKIPNTIVLKEKTILDIDQGNTEYGGYGHKSTFVKYQDRIENRPILISREISNWIPSK